MPGRLLLPLDFASDADLAIDFLILDATGNPVDLTGYGADFACALENGGGGFEASVGSGVLVPGVDGRVRVRIPDTEMNERAGRYDPCELRLVTPGGQKRAIAAFTLRVNEGASQIIGGAPPSYFGPVGVGTYTVTINADGNIGVTVGLPADDPIGAILTPARVVEYTGPGVEVGQLIGNSGTAPYGFSVFNSDGGRFAVEGSVLVTGATPILRADGASRNPTIQVTDQAGASALISPLIPVFPATSPRFDLPAQGALLILGII